jgi:2-dehydropantoate 2-reductase
MGTLIVGAGAVGGFLAVKLIQSGKDVTVLARAGRADILRRDGLRLIAADGGPSVVAPRVRTAAELTEPADLVILAVKAAALPGAFEDIAGVVGPRTTILPLLNGIEHLALIEARYPGRSVGGVCVVATQLADDGTIRQLAPGASVSYGELDGEPGSSRIEAVARELDGADFGSSASATIRQDMWEKWLFMAAGGAATVLLGGPAGTITAVDGGTAVIRALLAELIAVVTAAGHAPRPEALERITGALLTPGSPFTTSLYRDFAHGQATEGETILGDLARLAEREGVPHPLLSAAAVRLRVHEQSR